MVEEVGLDGLTEEAAPGPTMEEEVVVLAAALASSFPTASSRFRRHDMKVEARMWLIQAIEIERWFLWLFHSLEAL